MRRLPGPADSRLSEGVPTPEALYELFRDWQRTQTQSSVTALGARDSKWMSGSAWQEPTAERYDCARKHPDRIQMRALPSAPQISRAFLLTLTNMEVGFSDKRGP